jgi:hypothetical protein
MRVAGSALIALACLVGGCRPEARTDPGQRSETPTPTAQAAARCGGSDPVSGLHWVVAGTETVFYTATTRQVVRFKPDTKVETKTDAKGTVTGLTVVYRDNKTNIDCGCPAGCKNDPPGRGCVVQYVPGGPDASCTGDCVAENSCCTGCGFMAPF